MKDKLCLIPYSDIEFDKTYTNISEYFLRGNSAVSAFLGAAGVDHKILCGECSDFDLLRIFLKTCLEENAFESAVVQTFVRIIQGLIDEFSLDAEELWKRTSKALIENKLRTILASSGLKEVGVPVFPKDFFDEHFSSIKGMSIVPVACPFGTQNVSFDTFDKKSNLSELRDIIGSSVSQSKACAVFANDLIFEKPNEYTAAKAYEKYIMGQTLLNKEKMILVSQLLRMTAWEALECGREMMIFLPFAPNVKSMGAVSELIDYLDECDFKNRLSVSVFGGDAVSLCMAESIAGKRYKKITAAAGICGNGSDLPDLSSAKYWGFGASSVENFASLAKTPALLPSR